MGQNVSNISDTAAAVQAGIDSVEAANRIVDHEGENADFVIAIGTNGVPFLMKDILEADEARADTPARRTGRRSFEELASFIDAVNRWKIAGNTIVWARAATGGGTLVAVFNDAPPTTAEDGVAPLGAWGDDAAVYTTPISTELGAWIANNGKAMTQDAFGDWIESRLADLALVRDERSLPAPTDVLTMARDLQIRTKGEFVRQIDRVTGAGALIVRDERESTSTPIYRGFIVRVPIFRGGQLREIEARIRFGLEDGKRPVFRYELYRLDDLIREEFNHVRDTVRAACEGVPVFAGSSS